MFLRKSMILVYDVKQIEIEFCKLNFANLRLPSYQDCQVTSYQDCQVTKIAKLPRLPSYQDCQVTKIAKLSRLPSYQDCQVIKIAKLLNYQVAKIYYKILSTKII
jgi:hypothetical protein